MWKIVRFAIGFPLMYFGMCCMGKENFALLVKRLSEDTEFSEIVTLLKRA